MLTTEELEARLQPGYETRGFELKGPGSRTGKPFRVKVVRAVLGMGNLRDGGYVVIGIADTNPQLMLPGLSPDELESWTAYDDVSDVLAIYADPPVRFDLAAHTLSNGVTVAVLQVHE